MLGFSDQQKSALHLTWVAFFLTFVAWFNMAPFNTTIMKQVGLSLDQIEILMICNVALTIPARIIIGVLVDRHGPRKVFCGLLLFAASVCFYFATSTQFFEFLIARLLMGIVGAGFVVGIKMIAEWFPPEKMGIAQGIYAGWGNFGAAAAAFSLPVVALLFPEEMGWRAATAFSGLLCLIWAGVYWKWAVEIPDRGRDFKVSLIHSIEVTSRKDLILQIVLMLPVYGSLLALVWKLSALSSPLFSQDVTLLLYAGVSGIFFLNLVESLRVNLPNLKRAIPKEEHYEFRQIFILSLVYALTFGAELAVVSMFPQFLETTFGLSVATAGILGSSFAVMNLITRPSGGWLSDLLGRRQTLAVLVLGALAGFWAMGEINASWHLGWVILLAITCSVFLQAGNGACFAAVPLIRKDLTGKMAGMAGAYGNVGAVFFLTAYSLVSAQDFFRIIGGYAIVVCLCLLLLQSFKKLHVSYQ
ncbi:MAG: MFS transporter [Nitrospinae bacterium]|nr:MFS transporter [Nitrospinota bacterium]MDA1109219.1 MFS transporter [Nitrospinota bacterium]